MRNSEFYDLKKVFRYLLMIIGVSAFIKVTNGAGYVIIGPMVLVALMRKRIESMLFWLFYTNLAIIANGLIIPKGFIFTLTLRGVMVIAGLYSILLFASSRSSKFVTPVLGVLIYLFYMIIPSANGWAPMISYLKLMLFISIYLALAYTAAKAIEKPNFNMREVRSFFLAFAIFYIVGSILLIPFPGISMMNLEQVMLSAGPVTSLYQGMTNHSQTLGMAMCFFGAFLVADLIFMVQKPDKLYLFILACALFLLYKSSGRTAMGTLIATTGFLFMCFLRSSGIRATWKRRVMSAAVMSSILIGLAILVTPQLREGIMKFVLKYGNDTVTTENMSVEDVVKTRQGLVESQLYNFSRRPMTGWGFQVSPQVAEMVRRTDGVVLTAPVEKGVWVTAILEEGGVIGEIIYVLYFISAFFLLYSRKAYMSSGMFIMIHIANLGEMTMFAMSGVAALMYLLLFTAIIFDAKRITGATRMPVYR